VAFVARVVFDRYIRGHAGESYSDRAEREPSDTYRLTVDRAADYLDDWYQSGHAKQSQPDTHGPYFAAALVAYYNFCRVHSTLRITPAMAAGITNHIWSIGGVADGDRGSMIMAKVPKRENTNGGA